MEIQCENNHVTITMLEFNVIYVNVNIIRNYLIAKHHIKVLKAKNIFDVMPRSFALIIKLI